MQTNLQSLKQVKEQGGSVKEFVGAWKASVEGTVSVGINDLVPNEVVNVSNPKTTPSAASSSWVPSIPLAAVLQRSHPAHQQARSALLPPAQPASWKSPRPPVVDCARMSGACKPA